MVSAVSEGPKVGQLAGLPTDGATGEALLLLLHSMGCTTSGRVRRGRTRRSDPTVPSTRVVAVKYGTRAVPYGTNQFSPIYGMSRLIRDSWQPYSAMSAASTPS